LVLEFTGERYVPSEDGPIKYEHLHRYGLSLALAKGKSVLDLACGEGYGTALLAQVAELAIGVDIDAPTISHARQNYYYQNLKFLVGSCESIPLPDQSVELVTSFETIEHHDKHEEMMQEIKRVLKPGGLLVISSPNRSVYSDEANFVNEFHVKELYYDELMELLGRHFQYVHCHGQRLATGSFVYPLTGESGDSFQAYTGDPALIKRAVCALAAPAYFLVVCSTAPLPELQLDSVYLDNKDDLFRNLEAERLNHIRQLQTQIESLNENIAAERTTHQHQLAAFAAEHVKQAELEWGRVRAVELEQQAEQAKELNRSREQLAIYEAQCRELTQSLRAVETQLRLREEAEAEHIRELGQRDEQLSVCLTQMDQLSQSLANAHTEQTSLQLMLTQASAELAEAKLRKAADDAHYEEAEHNIAQTRALLAKKSEVLDWMQTSRSWQFVASLRRFERYAYRMRAKFQRDGSKVFVGKIDPIEGLTRGSTRFGISGWAFSRAAPITHVEAFLDDQYLGSVGYGRERRDMHELGADKASGHMGFAGPVLLTSPFTGPRRLVIRVFDALGNKELFTQEIIEGGPRVAALENGSRGANDSEPIALNTSSAPLLSIIVPVFNQSGYTRQCLRSIKDALAHTALKTEVIVVDDSSTDDTQQMLTKVGGIRVVTMERNSGFIDACNRGAALASGEYLLFLNNDTIVRNRCFEELIETFKLRPDAGLVGAKLLYPDGRLQEAGGIIWNDASGWNYGRFDEPEKPEYCYLREVDYCSGAAISIPKQLFEKLNGFDVRYRPAYCEDSDLAFRVRQAGFKVYYQPLAQAVHFEGITSGTDVSQGAKSYQVLNQKKFLDRWSKVLASSGQPGANPYAARERKVKKRILVLDACVLTPDQDAGSLTVFNHIKIFQSLGYKVTFVPDNLHRDEKYTANLQRIGVECLYWPYTVSIKSHLEAYGSHYDLVFVARVDVAEKHIDNLRIYCRRAKLIFDTEDLHFVREQRRAELENNEALAISALKRKQQELTVAAKADCTIVVSGFEKETLLKECPSLNVSVVPIPRDMPGRMAHFAQRKDLIFIGGFQHPPNLDAVLYFVRSIFPLIKLEIPDIKLFIIGSKAPNEILDLTSQESIIVTGYVDDLAPPFNQCRLSVAPLRYGAGVKGKVITSLSYGLPVVATEIACEGLGLTDEVDVLIADEPSEFARKVVRLYTDAELWNKLSMAGFDKMNERHAPAVTKSFFEELFATLLYTEADGVVLKTEAKAAGNNNGSNPKDSRPS
jgi:GT2 family glycosyltransferase/SAM-dependent methyltransferase/glycosyltransferase involved in cell wall biosynthesis